MAAADPTDAAGRLAALKASTACIAYFVNLSFDPKHELRLSVYGAYPTAEIFLELTDGRTTRVQAFLSRHKNCPPEVRREDLPLVDQADAFNLARKLRRRWPGRKKAGGRP